MKQPWLLAVLLIAGCKDARELYSLTTALNSAYLDTQVGVMLTDGIILTVTLVDSPLLRAPCDSQVATAMRVATLVRQHYATFDSLQIVNVAFAPGRSSPPLPARLARLPVRFARAAISAGLTASDSMRAVDACRAYEELQ